MSKGKKITIWSLVIIALIVVFYMGTGYQENKMINEDTKAGAEATQTTVVYNCDGGKTIDTTYHTGKAVGSTDSQAPDGWVVVSFDGAPALTLNQTISADGARYANPDESLVFWSKGDQALVMKHNTMDLTYTNCKAANQNQSAS